MEVSKSSGLARKLLRPVFVMGCLAAGLVMLAGVTELIIARKHAQATEASAAALQMAEIRSLSRALQRDALNLIFETERSEREKIAEKFAERVDQARRDTQAMATVLGEDGADKARTFSELQAGVIDNLVAVSRMSGQASASATFDRFRNLVRPAERKASKVVDAYIDEKTLHADQLLSEAEQAEDISLLLLLAGAAVGTLAGVRISRRMIRRDVAGPLGDIAGVMAELAADNRSVEIPYLDCDDEIGQMARAVEVFKVNAIEVERLRAEQIANERQELERRAEQAQREAEAQRDAEEQRQREQAKQRAAMLSLADNFERSVGDVVSMLSSAATQLQGTAEAMSATAEQTKHQATTVSSASDEAAVSVQTAATAGEEMSVSIAEISQQVALVADATRSAVAEAERADTKVQNLVEAAEQIDKVVALITTIAGQTNLLALNATIEAARAGEAGKGFAVVASEVKTLATQTANATNEIAAQIAKIQEATQQSVDAIRSIGATIASIDQVAGSIATAAEQQSGASQEVARSVQAAAQATTHVSAAITDVREAAAETGTAAAQVLISSSDLARQAVVLREQVGAFLASVRAA